MIRHHLFLLLVCLGVSLADPVPEPLAEAEADADAKTYGYIQTLHIVDEEDLPANPEDFLKKHLNSNTNVLTRDFVLKQKNQVRHQPPQLAVPRDEFTSDGDVDGDVDDRAAIQTNEIKDQGEEDPDTGKICVDKVMFREETNYTEVMTCDHSYDERCHTSYITSYSPHQEEDCDEKFRKICWITYEDKAVNEVVEECITQNVKNCAKNGTEECTTVYDTVCETSQDVHEVEDDVVNCKTVNKEMCKTVQNGFLAEEKCELWPQEKCEITPQKVTKYSPKVQCKKLPREICTAGCAIEEADPVCNDKVKAVIVSKPVEECHMEPQKICKQSTKLVPELVPTQECVQVPKEVCAMTKTNPHKIKIPFIQKWCYDPKEVNGRVQGNFRN